MPQLSQTFVENALSLTVRGVSIFGVILLGACARPVPIDQINDPYETENRSMHAFNVGLDEKLVKPISGSIGGKGRGPLSLGLKHFVDNLDGPRDVLNNLLQLRIGRAAHNTLRFAVNSTIGIGGLFDPASAMGVEPKPTDFGETLYVWGVDEGHYLELPVLGPSTARDAFGKVVDYAINPVAILVKSPESYALTAAKLADSVVSRERHADIVDSVLHDSADSYAQARLLYLQNRRYDLGQKAADETAIDPYEDPYGQ